MRQLCTIQDAYLISMSVLRLHLQHKIIKTAFSGKLLLAPYRENGSYFVLDSGVGAGETYSVLSHRQYTQ